MDSKPDDNIITPVKPSKGRIKAKGKSGRARTANNTVKNKFTWPHELVYERDGRPVEYKSLTIVQFV